MLEDKIVSIEEVEEGVTVDIEVDGDNLFFVNDILTHNSQLNRYNKRKRNPVGRDQYRKDYRVLFYFLLTILLLSLH